MTTRMFKFPCRYLIYLPTFDAFSPKVLSRGYQRLWEVLSGKDQSLKFSQLSTADRKGIVEILKETKVNLSPAWTPNILYRTR